MDVKIKFLSEDAMGEFYRNREAVMGEFYRNRNAGKTAADLARALLEQGCYNVVNFGAIDYTGRDAEDIAEDIFDLTNNPGRIVERLEHYGRGRSVSVGDVVEVNGVNYVCASVGWEQVG